MKIMNIVGIVFSILSLTGCGVSDNTSGGGTVTPTTRPIVSNTLRTFTNGDNIQYSMTGSVTTGGVNLTLTGTATSSFTANSSPFDPTGVTRSVKSLTMSGTFSDGTPFVSNGSSFYSQDATGNFNIYGDSIGFWITTPATGFVTGVKSPIVSPDSWVNFYIQQNGDKTNATVTVLGNATVTTGMGTFQTYMIQTVSTVTRVAGGVDVSNEIDYVVPRIGPIKVTTHLQSTDAAGAVTTSQFTLIASTTNIAF